MIRILLAGVMMTAGLATPATAAMVEHEIPYSMTGTGFTGVLIYDDAVTVRRPAVLMAPNWMGITANARTKARMLAGQDYVIFIADMYGATVRPATAGEARTAAGGLRNDIAAMRARVNKGMDVLLAQGSKRGLIDPAKTAAIGFCFGGGNVLELARSGRDVNAVVSFHGSLGTPNPADAANITAKILILHGADDPAAPKAQRDALEAELSAVSGLDWQMVAFSGAVHSFTNPDANRPGRSQYHAAVTQRAYTMMHAFFDEIF